MNELIVLPNPPDTNVGPTGPGPDEREKARLKRAILAPLWRRGLRAGLDAWDRLGRRNQISAARGRGLSRRHERRAKTRRADEAERGDIRALREEIRALQAKLDSLDKRSDAPERGTLEAQLNSLDRKIEANHADAANVAAQIEARLEKNDKSMGRLEAAISAKSLVPSTASNDAKGSVKPAAKSCVSRPGPGSAATAGGANAKAADAAKPIGDYTLREVQDGIALVQGRAGGLYEVGPGDRLPGAGKVLAVEKIGQKWVVVTESGRIDGQAPAPQPRYSQRRDPGGYYFDGRF